MAYSQNVLLTARSRLLKQRVEHTQKYESDLAMAHIRYPRLAEIDRELRLTMSYLMANAIRQGEDPTAAINELRDQNLALQREREWILEVAQSEGLVLDDSPICEKCGGSGYIGSQMCSCLHELCRQEQVKELTSLLGKGDESFESFRPDHYSDLFDPNLGASPRKLMQSNFNICKKYAQSFTPSSGSLLFSGATGLGKTFLSACVAREVIDRGFSVVYESAIRIFSDFEEEHFGDNVGMTLKYFETDLLIIDDLGTEMTTQFTTSMLYHVINTRLLQGRATIISTNLMPDAIEKRYSPQIASRLIGTYRLIKFVGEDIRRK